MTDAIALPRLVIVSNRGPYQLHATRQGLRREKSVGGLVTSVLPMLEQVGGTWIAWGEPAGRHPVPAQQPRLHLRYLSLSAEQVQGHYHGFSNSALWPLCHYFLGRVHYDPAQWLIYQQVNALFAEAVDREAGADDLIWVHDYQLALAPQAIRQARPAARLLFFWHIPFPAVEIYRTLPWRKEVLAGLLACDLIGFHIPEYAQNFIEAAVDLLGATYDGRCLAYDGRQIRVIARPIGIDFAAVDHEARAARMAERARTLRQSLGEPKLILGVERMDYTKGVLERLLAVERLLERRPEWAGRLTLIQIATPSRTEVGAYRDKKREIDEAVGRINGRFGDALWAPIRYLYRAVSLPELIAYYRASDIALVTPLRDGLNLVAKEYVAARVNADGVLILSEFAGVAQQLPEALLTNPYSADDMAATLEQALQMPAEEQQRRMRPMRERVKTYDINWWAREFLSRMETIP